MTIVFKIRRKSDGLFSTGGERPKFNKKGKSWVARGHVSNHLAIFDNSLKEKYYKDCEVVTVEIVETDVETIDVVDWKPTDKSLRAKELKAIRREKHIREYNLREIERHKRAIEQLNNLK